MQHTILTIKYNINRPVPLADFVASLQSLQRIHGNDELQLCVKEIRKGSYVFDLINQIPDALIAVMPLVIEQTDNLARFASNLKTILDFFKSGEKLDRDTPITRQEAIAAHNFVLPLTVDNRSTLEFGNIHVAGDVNVYTYTEANAIQNSARRYIEELDRTTGDIKQGVSLQWKNLADTDSTGNKSVIPEIHPRSVTTHFANEKIHQQMVRKVAHPFEHLWEVNVHVDWHGDIPKRYTIVEIKEDLGTL